MGKKVFKEENLKKPMQNKDEREELIKKIVMENLDVLKAIADLDRDFGNSGRIIVTGEKVEATLGTSSVTVQEIYKGYQNAGT
ncbi:MAG: hypothetical protein JRN37_02305 [Nitrososphaerota archaeon]|nr:hypothetical protein [Nitrososphaerota archaeon]